MASTSSETALAAAIGRIAEGRDQQRYMIMLGRRGNAEADHHLVEEARRRAALASPGEIVADLEHQLVGSDEQRLALEQRPVAAAVAVGDGARHPVTGRAQAIELD